MTTPTGATRGHDMNRSDLLLLARTARTRIDVTAGTDEEHGRWGEENGCGIPDGCLVNSLTIEDSSHHSGQVRALQQQVEQLN